MDVSRKTVLYVDDEEVNLFIFERMFESHFNILTAPCASDALEKLSQYADRIDVVITDMRMPGLDGLQFVHLAREKFPEISYYVLTAFSYNPEVEKAIENHIIRRAFTKPLDLLAITNELSAA